MRLKYLRGTGAHGTFLPGSCGPAWHRFSCRSTQADVDNFAPTDLSIGYSQVPHSLSTRLSSLHRAAIPSYNQGAAAMIAATAVSIMLSAPGLQVPVQGGHVGAWFKPLSHVARLEQASLCVDVDGVSRPRPCQYPRRAGRTGLDRLAAAIDRTRIEVDGVHVFRRQVDRNDLRLSTPHQHAMAFLQSLGATDTSRLRRGLLEFPYLPFSTQRRLRFALARLGNGLGDSMLANYPDRIGMRLMLEPTAVGLSRSGDGNVRLALDVERGRVPLREKPRNAVEPAPLGRPADGELEFGDGRVATLAQIAQEAEAAFGRPIWFDGRLSETFYFLSGTYTEDRLLAVLSAVTETFSVQPAPEGFSDRDFTKERTEIVELAFGPYRDDPIGVADLTYGDLIVGRQTSFHELFGDRPPRHVMTFMNRYRIQPTDGVTVEGELFLAFAAPGIATLETGERDGLGRPVTYNVPHYLRLGF